MGIVSGHWRYTVYLPFVGMLAVAIVPTCALHTVFSLTEGVLVSSARQLVFLAISVGMISGDAEK